MRKLTPVVCAALLASGLASGCVSAVTHQPASANGTGIRYYGQSPYLLIYSNSKGGLQWQILYLPDQSKLMMATPTLIGGRQELTMYFQNGVLTGSSEVSDTAQLPRSIIAAIQSAAPLLAGASFAADPNEVPAPYLFKIVVNGANVELRGGQGDTKIRVPLVEAAP